MSIGSSQKTLFFVVLALLGLFASAGLLATNFQVYEVSPGEYADSIWPGTNPIVTWNENFIGLPANVDENGTGVTPMMVLTNAFRTWAGASYRGVGVTNISFAFGSASASFPQAPALDCRNVIGFADPNASSDFPSGVIAFASITTVPSGYVPGSNCPSYTTACPIGSCIVDVDIMFNPSEVFATSQTGYDQYDLQSVATHEIGHMIGLDHSNIAHAIMYPYGDTTAIGINTILSIDDIIGIRHLYPNPASPENDEISGTVTLDNNPLFAADVLAIDASTGNVVTETLTDPSGNYRLRVFDGTYYVYVQGLAPSTNAGPTTVNNFRGQAGYGGNNFSNIPPSSTTANYTGQFY
jgi:hypothetical protein